MLLLMVTWQLLATALALLCWLLLRAKASCSGQLPLFCWDQTHAQRCMLLVEVQHPGYCLQ
jgi:hypothetical protein